MKKEKLTMRKKTDFEEFLKRLKEVVENTKDEGGISYRPVFIDISVNICPNMDFMPSGPSGINVMKEEKIPVDIIETEKNIHAVIGLEGMEKENIKLSCNGKVLGITASNAIKTLSETIELPSRVVKKGMKTTFENGILEVIFNKSKHGKSRSRNG